MNLYFLVEGSTEKKVYRAWVGHVFPTLMKVERLEDLRRNNYLLFSIDGNISRRDNIGKALKDIENHNATAPTTGSNPIDRLFICLDTEDISKRC